MREINEIDFADEANLEIKANHSSFYLKHKLNLKNNAFLGLIFLFAGGLFMAGIPLFKSTDNTSKYLCMIIGLPMSLFSILTLIRGRVDFVEIKSDEIIFRYNLKLTKLKITGSMKIRTETDTISISRVGTLGSDFLQTTFYLLENGKEYSLFFFQTKKTDEEKAKTLSAAISNLLNEKIHCRITK